MIASPSMKSLEKSLPRLKKKRKKNRRKFLSKFPSFAIVNTTTPTKMAKAMGL